jgi:uncharacterized membrane protein
MTHIAQEIAINAPIGVVFRKLLDVETSPEWMSNLEEVRNVTGHNVGASFDWTFKMAGRPFKGTTIFAEIVPNDRLVEESTGGITSKWDWHLTPLPDGGTNVRVAVDYTVPGSFLGAIADKLFIERQNEKDLRQSLSNLKQMLEK